MGQAMKVLLLGCSLIAERRALAALRSLSGVRGIDAASRRGAECAGAFVDRGCAYGSVETALLESDAELVYISTENSAHADLADAALSTKRHVIIDKPAFQNLDTTERLLQKAVQAGRVLAEATVFLDHPRLAALTKLFATYAWPTQVLASFSFPPLRPDNFRYDPARGGGAFPDLGPYAAATCRYFFAGLPDAVYCRILKRDRVETAFTVTATFSDGRCFSGIYGFNSEYQNWVSAAGPGIAVRLDRFCTPPPDQPLAIEVRRDNSAEVFETAAGDCFVGMFARVIDAIASGKPDDLHAAMRADAAFRERMRVSAS